MIMDSDAARGDVFGVASVCLPVML